MKAILLDASALIQGYEPTSQKAPYYTVQGVVSEVKNRMGKLRIESALGSGRLRIVAPGEVYEEMLEEEAVGMGESHVLSVADKELLSLALQFKEEGRMPVIVSDDYSVQNMADKLEIQYKGLATPGIKRRLKWVLYCPGCRRSFDKPQPENICPVCGTMLKRKPEKKRE